MFKARWRSEKNRIRAVFKLQFQATQVPLSGWDALMVSLIPADVGKPTAKSDRAAVVDGVCVWENPVQEIVKLSRDAKTGKIGDKVYRFVLSANELPKARVLGEATLDFADHAEAAASKPGSTVVLPLKGSNCGTALHVTVHRVQDDADSREGEENGKNRRTLLNQMSNGTEDDTLSSIESPRKSTEDGYMSNGQTKLKFHSSRAIVQPVEYNGNITKSRSFDATSAIGSNCSSERNTPRDDRSRTGTLSRDSATFLSPLRNDSTLQKPTSNPSGLATINGDNWGSNTDWSLSSAAEESLDGSTNSSEDRDRLQGPESLEKARSDLVNLARQVEVSELELQALRKQVVKERKTGEDLSKEVRTLKEERDTLRRKYELLKASQCDGENRQKNSLRPDGGDDVKHMIEELRQELDHEKNMNGNLHLQLQKTQESNGELILAVKDLEEMLEARNRETTCADCRHASAEQESVEDVSDARPADVFSDEQKLEHKESFGTISENEDDEELDLLAKERSDVGVTCSFEQRIAALSAEVELYKKDRESIEMQMEQLALDYEILKQENHDISNRLEQSQLREQLRMQYECSAHLSIISDLEAHVENLESEIEKQAETFESDLACITAARVEQEKRAIRAEEALHAFKWDNAKSLERLQQEFRRISAQMLTTFEAKEKLALEALEEASQLRISNKHLEELIEKMNTDLVSVKHQHKIQVKELISQIDSKTADADELHLKLKHLAEEMDKQRKTAEATEKALSQELSILKSATVMLSKEKSELCEQIGKEQKLMAELNKLQSSINQAEKRLLEKSSERDVLEAELASAKEEAEKSNEELNKMKSLSEGRDLVFKKLDSEINSLKEQLALLKSYQKEDACIISSRVKVDTEVAEVASSANRSTHPEGHSEADLHREASSAVGLTGDMEDSASSSPRDNEAANRCSPSTCCGSSSLSNESPGEIDTLREKNKAMEVELKEMQERYSEISLRFAEVEGERQQLVMRIRSLKNSMKS